MVADLEPDLRRVVRRGMCLALAAAAAVWAGHRAAGPGTHAQPEVTHWRVPLDRAAVADLELLPGVGPTLAVRLRAVCAQDPPTRPDDLRGVPRLGPVGRQRVTPWVAFAPRAVDRGDVGAGPPPRAGISGVALSAAP